MATFVLVHGAWHGAWCWDRLRPALSARGHSSITLDLPCDEGTATFTSYASHVLSAVPADASDLVLVGHSLGAMTVPLVAARRPVRALVLLCPVIPNLSGLPWEGGPPMEDPGVFDALTQHADGATSWPDAESARAAFYADCRPEDAEWAFPQLRRQNNSGLWAESYPLTAWLDVETHVIAGDQDRVITPEWVQHAAPRVGAEPLIIPGGHSPFLARPDLLADTLNTLLVTQ